MIVPTSSLEPIDNQEEPWTIECVVDNLTVRLAEVKETIYINDKDIPVRKYYRQARELSKWIPIAKPSPAFIIYISDLTSQLKDSDRTTDNIARQFKVQYLLRLWAGYLRI